MCRITQPDKPAMTKQAAATSSISLQGKCVAPGTQCAVQHLKAGNLPVGYQRQNFDDQAATAFEKDFKCRPDIMS